MVIRGKTKSISKKDAIRELWKRGELDYKRHDGQMIIDKVMKTDPRDIITILAARRFGKSYQLALMAVELCQSKPDSIVKYICPRLKMVKTIMKPNMKKILKDCPADMLPEWKENDKMYIFPNGSEIHLAGTDNGSHESIRGGHADLCIVDEAGFCDHLKYVVYDILAPTTDTTGGRVILASTPSKHSDHDFIQHFVIPCEAQGKLIKFVLHDNPMLTDIKKASIAARHPAGVEDPGYRREYLCEIIRDKSSVVIPGFTPEKELKLVTEWKRPAYFDFYVGGDVGFRDLTVYLFGYWDYMKATLVIEDELVLNGDDGMTTKTVAEGIKAKEKLHYPDQRPMMRVMDNNLIMMQDLNLLHNLPFLATEKDNKEAQVNNVNIMINADQIVINPRCKHLIYHLKGATWRETTSNNPNSKREFAHLPDTPDFEVRGGHADALDALIYLVRNLIRTKNPYPKDWGRVMGDNVFQTQLTSLVKQEGLVAQIKQILNIKN